jgi:Ankyrin repeats (3 copies)
MSLFQMSPQEHLDALLRDRGYTVTSRHNSGKIGRASLPDEAPCEAHYDTHIVDIVKRDNPEPLRALLAQGIKQNPCNSLGESIANLACRLGSINILKVLIDAGCDTKTSDTHGRTCLHEACRAPQANWAILELILRRHIEWLSVIDEYGLPPLDYVDEKQWDDWVQFLTSKADEYFPKTSAINNQSGMVDIETDAAGKKRVKMSFDIIEIDSESESSEDESDNSELSDVLFATYESEMVELVALMDSRMGRNRKTQ